MFVPWSVKGACDGLGVHQFQFIHVIVLHFEQPHANDEAEDNNPQVGENHILSTGIRVVQSTFTILERGKNI